MNRSGFGLLAALTVLVSACGQAAKAPAIHSATAGASDTGTTASASASPSTQRVPTSATGTFHLLPAAAPSDPNAAGKVTCSGSIGSTDWVAIVRLHVGGIVLRDYADPSHPRTACQFTAATSVPELIDARHVVIGDNSLCGHYAVVDLPSAVFHWFQLPRVGECSTFLAVAPSLQEVAWISPDMANNSDNVHLTTAAGDRVVASLPDRHGGRCGSPDDSKQAAYSRSGAHLYVLDQQDPLQTNLLILHASGIDLQVKAVPTGLSRASVPNMAVWSPVSDILYYRNGGDVWRWTPGSDPQRFLTGVNWYYPTLDAKGATLAYAVPRSTAPDTLHDVYLSDLSGTSPRKITQGARNQPVYLNDKQLWYKAEGTAYCGPTGTRPLVYDMADSTESASVIDDVLAIWPMTSSNR